MPDSSKIWFKESDSLKLNSVVYVSSVLNKSKKHNYSIPIEIIVTFGGILKLRSTVKTIICNAFCKDHMFCNPTASKIFSSKLLARNALKAVPKVTEIVSAT